MNEADTCRKEVIPRLAAAGWDDDPHSFTEQRTFTDGRIIPSKKSVRRGKQNALTSSCGTTGIYKLRSLRQRLSTRPLARGFNKQRTMQKYWA